MAFIPPLNLGQFQPSPATLSQWVYQIWQFLQENPIATEEEIRTYIESELTESTTLSTAIEDYLTENPPDAPVQSVQGKTGAVTLAYNDIVTSSNTIPVYKASSTPSTSTLVGQYNLGYRLFVNTATQEIYTISPAGALSLVGRGSFDGTDIDVDTSQGDTTIAEAIADLTNDVTALAPSLLTNGASTAVPASTYTTVVSLTIQTSGIYVVYGDFTFSQPAANGDAALRYKIGSTETSPIIYFPKTTSEWFRLSAVDIFELSAGDVIELQAYTTTGVNGAPPASIKAVRV